MIYRRIEDVQMSNSKEDICKSIDSLDKESVESERPKVKKKKKKKKVAESDAGEVNETELL